MSFIKKIITFLLLVTIVGCTYKNVTKINSANEKTISFDTPNDKYNIIFREYLKRKFNNKGTIIYEKSNNHFRLFQRRF